MPSTWGRLWVIATPLGNLGDFPPRAVEVIEGCSLLLAEDTRRTKTLLSALQVAVPRMLSLFEHNEEYRVQGVLDILHSSRDVALVSDAGTPVISDPGYRLVRRCHEQGIKVTSVPGPCAATTALSISGLPTIPFSFLGFLPRHRGEVSKLFQQWLEVQSTLIFFERKNRLKQTLETALEILGDRECCVVREITKRFEETLRGRLADFPLSSELQGEITVVLGPPEEMPFTSREAAREFLEKKIAEGKKPRQAVKEIRELVHGWSGKELYALLHENPSGEENR